MAQIKFYGLILAILLGFLPEATVQFLEARVQQVKPAITAPDFNLKKVGGGKISLRDLRGKIVLLSFFAPWCDVCQKQASSFEKLAQEYKARGARFLLVASKAREKDLREFQEEYQISSPILLDENGSVARAYGVFGHHETFFINRKGKIVAKTFALQDWTSPAVKSFMDDLLAEGKEPGN